MRVLTVGERRYAQWERLREVPGLIHAFSTRPVDLSPRDGPGAQEREAARRQMARDWGLDAHRLSWCMQVHRPEIRAVDPGQTGRLEDCDGVITCHPGIPLMTFSADCPLVLAFDPLLGCLGMVHASWRCTVSGAAQRLVEQMRADFGCHPARMLAGIGPSAGPERYEVGAEVWEAAAALEQRERVFHHRDGRLYFDLWEANRLQLARAGIPPGHIEIAGICTMTRTDLFFSRRREGPACGHFALLAGIAPRRC